MRRTLFTSAAALVFVSAVAGAQARPNFSGKWTMIPDTTVAQRAMAAGNMGGLGQEATIVMDEKTMTVTRNTANMGEFKSVFNLDGTETFASVNVQNQAIPLTMKVRWDGAKLITSTWANVGQTIEIVMNYSIDDKGNLVTEHTFPDMGNGSGGGTIVVKYKKAG